MEKDANTTNPTGAREKETILTPGATTPGGPEAFGATASGQGPAASPGTAWKAQEQPKGLRSAFRSGSPEEVREAARNAVQKSVAAIAGALRGFNEEIEKSHLPERARDAIHRAGETTREAIRSTTEQVRGLREPTKETTRTTGEAAKGAPETAGEKPEGKAPGGSVGTNPVGGNVYPHASNVRGTSLREDAMQSSGPDAPEERTKAGPPRDARER